MDAVAEKIDAATLEKAYAQAGVVPPARKRATEDEKDLLRGSIVRKASQEEADAWVAQNIRFLTQKAQNAFTDMSDEDKFRVMSEGAMTECRDATEILYGRVKRFMDMEAKLKSMANADPSAVEKSKDKKISTVALSIAHQMSTPKLEEVPENERRTGTVVGTGPAVDVPKAPEKALVGTRQGVGGVIEALQKKYMMQKGDRAKVVAETKELWKMEGDINVPKTHRNSGWKWVIQGEEAAALKKAEEKARKQREKEEADQQKAEEEKRRKEAKRKEEAAPKSRSNAKESKKKKKSRQWSNSRSQSSPSRSRADRKSKEKTNGRKSDVPSDTSCSANSHRAGRKRRRKCSDSHSSDSARQRRRR